MPAKNPPHPSVKYSSTDGSEQPTQAPLERNVVSARERPADINAVIDEAVEELKEVLIRLADR